MASNRKTKAKNRLIIFIKLNKVIPGFYNLKYKRDYPKTRFLKKGLISQKKA
jgi:ribosomal protein L39E